MPAIRIDARGLACPEPLMAFLDAAKKADAVEICCDNHAARENITRAANSIGWQLDSVSGDPGNMLMSLTKIV